MTPIPPHPRRVLLVNPTRYLGNLLLAGGLMQDYVAMCRARGTQVRILLDESFRGLLQGVLPDEVLLFYPRRAIANAALPGKLARYLTCLRTLRAFGADLAFNIEEDSVSHRLTLWSGARFRLGCSKARHGYGYHHVVPIDFSQRPPERRHRWYSFAEVFAAVGLPESSPGYLRFPPVSAPTGLPERMQARGLVPERRFVALHAGATKQYKQWPLSHFVALARALVGQGWQVALIGAGADAVITSAILAQLPGEAAAGQVVDCCGHFSLGELPHLLKQAGCMVGNDSGPFHLAAALGVPGTVIFGPTDVDLWRPLSAGSLVIKGTEPCSPDCTRRHCLHAHRCLRSISPESILATLPPIGPAAAATPEALRIS